MKVAVDVSNDSAASWLPEEAQISNWIETTFTLLELDTPLGVSLRFVDADASAALNSQYRNKQAATNVLSFPTDLPASICEQMEVKPLGDVVICPDIVEQEARDQDKSLEAHWAHMVMHGLLHLLGYQHEDEAGAECMENLEIRALEKLGFANPYLVG